MSGTDNEHNWDDVEGRTRELARLLKGIRAAIMCPYAESPLPFDSALDELKDELCRYW